MASAFYFPGRKPNKVKFKFLWLVVGLAGVVLLLVLVTIFILVRFVCYSLYFDFYFQEKTQNNPNVTSPIAARNIKYLVPSLLLVGLYWGSYWFMSGDHSIVSSMINLTQVSSNKVSNKVYR